MQISFFGDPRKRSIGRYLPRWIAWLTAQGKNVAVMQDLAQFLTPEVLGMVRLCEDAAALVQGCDLLVSLGGDGTILLTSRIVGDRNIPILGVKFGGLGFLADVAPEEFEEAFREITQGLAQRQPRMVLAGFIRCGDKTLGPHFALNDIVVQRQQRSHVTRISVWVDDHPVCTYISDGVIIATPTGSTAYSMAAGGPLLIPMLQSILITPICPHSLTARPLVISDRSQVRIAAGKGERLPLLVSADGEEMGALQRNDQLLVQKAEHTVTLLHRAGKTFFDVLRAKLNWGDDIRQKDHE